MDDKALYWFYENALLPQFGVINVAVKWDGSQVVGPGKTVHYFSRDRADYALLFEDYSEKRPDDALIRDQILERHTGYKIVPPTSESSNTFSYNGFCPAPPYMYCANITGSFTLLKLTN